MHCKNSRKGNAPFVPGLTAKFSQNPFLKQLLLDTRDSNTKEASAKVWGVEMILGQWEIHMQVTSAL